MRVGRTTVTYRTAEQNRSRDECSKGCLNILGLIVLVAIPIGLYVAELNQRRAVEAFSELERSVVPGVTGKDVRKTTSELVHLTGELEPTNLLCDPEFNMCGEGAVRIRRQTEYCQWTQHHTDKEEKDREGNSVTTRTYYYLLGWEPYPVMSVLFDQPFAHNNPQRDPYPGREYISSSASVGPYTVPEPLLRKLDQWRRVDQVTPDQIRAFRESPAASEFQYIGSGWFMSPYQASMTENLAKFAGRALEGSLDFQLGDLFRTCEPGDIRVRFHVVDPHHVTIVAKQTTPEGLLGEAVASNGYKLSLIKPGLMSASAVFHLEFGRLQNIIRFVRFLAVLWGVVALLMGRFTIQRLASVTWVSGAVGSLLLAAMLSAILHGLVWGATSFKALAVMGVCIVAFPTWLSIVNLGGVDAPAPPPKAQ